MKKKIRSANLYQFLLLLLVIVGLNTLVIVGLNTLGKFLFWRFDLTSEKRFTLSSTTKEKLKNLQDVVYIKVYLTGDLPAGFQRLSSATRDMLMEMKSYAGQNLEFDFIDPSAG